MMGFLGRIPQPRTGSPAWRLMGLFCALLMVLWGCQPSPLTAGRFVGIDRLTVEAPTLESQGAETRLLVRLHASLGMHAVPGTWTSAELKLTNATLLSAPQSKTVSQSGGSAVSTAFNALRPGAGYGLEVKLYNGATLVAQGSNASFSLAAGANTITVSLTTTGGPPPTPASYTMQAYVGTSVPPSGRAALSWAMAPSALALDSENRLYVADSAGSQVYRVENSGVLTRIAGNGLKGNSGDGGPATSASLNKPEGLAFDAAGNLYIADSGAHVIRMVDGSGNISRFAGTGSGTAGGDGQAPASVSLKGPKGLAFNANGDLLIAEAGASRVRFVPKAAGTYFGKSMQAGLMYTIAGTGVFDSQIGQIFPEGGGSATAIPLSYPYAVAFGPSGSVYFSDSSSSLILRVTSAGHMNRAAGWAPWGYQGDGGPPLQARLNQPQGIALDSSNNLYIADRGNNRLRRVVSNVISTYAGNGASGYSGDGGALTSAQVSGLGAMVFDSTGVLYVVDGTRVRKISGGTFSTIAGTGSTTYSGDGGLGSAAQINSPGAVTRDAAGDIYFADAYNYRIRKISAASGVITTIAGNGNYGHAGDGQAAISASFEGMSAIAVDSTGAVYVTDSDACRIRKISGGVITTAVGTGAASSGANGTVATSCAVAYPYGVAVDAEDNLYFADSDLSAIRMVPKQDGTYFGIAMTAGRVYTVAGNGTAGSTGDNGAPTSASLNYPTAVAFDTTGNMLILEYSGNRVRMVAKVAGTYYGKAMTANRIYTVAGDGTTGVFSSPNGLAVDAANNVFIADTNNHRIRRLTSDGTLTTVAGTGTLGYSGDGGAATSAALSGPYSVTVTSDGALVIADSGNHRLRKAVP